MTGRARGPGALLTAAACALAAAASCGGLRAVSGPPAGRGAGPDVGPEGAREVEPPGPDLAAAEQEPKAGNGVADSPPPAPASGVPQGLPPAGQGAPLVGGPAPAGGAAEEKGGCAGEIGLLPHVRINRREMYVDVDAFVCLARGALELLATTPQGKTHEAVFAITALPRHLHAALLLLGLQSGSPGEWGGGFGGAATGDRVRVFVTGFGDDTRAEVPVSEMVMNRDTGEKLPENVFVFAGSLLARPGDGERPVYAADVGGDVISLVSFPDEVLALPAAASTSNDMLVWEVNGAAVPPVGTCVVLRFRPAGTQPGEGADGRAGGRSSAPSQTTLTAGAEEEQKEPESPPPGGASADP